MERRKRVPRVRWKWHLLQARKDRRRSMNSGKEENGTLNDWRREENSTLNKKITFEWLSELRKKGKEYLGAGRDGVFPQAVRPVGVCEVDGWFLREVAGARQSIHLEQHLVHLVLDLSHHKLLQPIKGVGSLTCWLHLFDNNNTVYFVHLSTRTRCDV